MQATAADKVDRYSSALVKIDISDYDANRPDAQQRFAPDVACAVQLRRSQIGNAFYAYLVTVLLVKY